MDTRLISVEVDLKDSLTTQLQAVNQALIDTPTAKADGILGSPTRHNPAGLHQPS